jgi:protease secretion system membrane fusion protein
MAAQLKKTFKQPFKQPGYEAQGWLIIVFGFFGFIVWASLYPIDQGIPGAGFVIPKTEKIYISSPTNTLVSHVLKTSGSSVKPGELIMQLDAVPLEIEMKRLQESKRGLLTSIGALNLALTARNQQIASLKNQRIEIKRIIDGGFQSQKNALLAKNEHVKMIENQYAANLKLFEAGFLSRNALEKSKSELAWSQSESYDLGAKNEQIVTNSVQNLTATNTQIALAESELQELMANLAQNQSRLKELDQQINAIDHELTLTKVVSPVMGTIMNLSVKSPGVSVTIGQPLLEIVPDSEDLVIEVKLPVDYADRIHKDMLVDVMFPTLAGSMTKQLKGRLDYISKDKISDQRSNEVFFEARVSLLDDAAIKKDTITLGLPATVLINTGPRTLMSYMLRPFKDRLSMGMQ